MAQKTDWSLWHARLDQKLKQTQLLPVKSNILIAVSGGQDSLCLAKLILDLQPKWQWHIAIAHCNHNWSTDEGIAHHVEQVAHSLAVDFYLQQAVNLRETEAAARKWRYQVLQEIAAENNFNYLVTGHTKSDRAETFLYNLIRGTGADGLSSLDWHRNLNKNLNLVRPLLDFTRQETFIFCQQFNLPIWVDQANSNLQYARNRIRQELIPYLITNFNPKVENSLVQTAEILQAESQYLKSQAQDILQQIQSRDCRQLNRLMLQKVPLALQRRVIRQFLPSIIAKQPNFAQIEAIRNLVSAPNKTRTSTLSNLIVGEVSGEWIVFKQLD